MTPLLSPIEETGRMKVATDEIRDLRALAFPDEPYSAYCKVCWQNVYCLWIDEKDHHGGVCMFGHTKMQDCHQAMSWSEAIGKMKSYLRRGPTS